MKPILAPYGSLDYLPIATKVGDSKDSGSGTTAVLAPYGSLDMLPMATKVGGNGKVGAPLAPYGSLKFLPIATKVGVSKDQGGGNAA